MSERDYPIYFMKTMQEYLSALLEVYPTCVYVRAYELAFRRATTNKSEDEMREMGREGMQKYKAVMEPWFARCTTRDVSLLQENIEFLTDLGMKEKWRSMNQDTKDVIWQYILQLNQLCGAPPPTPPAELEGTTMDEENFPPELAAFLNIMPDNLKKNIVTVCDSYSQRIESGQMGIADLNMFEIADTLRERISEQDMTEFSDKMHNGDMSMDASLITQMLSQVPSEMRPAYFDFISKQSN